MTRIERMNFIQNESIKAWVNNNYIGTCYNSVGSGKTFIAFKAAYKLLELGLIKKGSNIRFWAETTARKITLKDEFKAFYDIYNKQVNHDFKIIFRCYQSLYKDDNIDFEIYDEMDYCLSAKRYVCIYHSTCKYKLGLTANINAVDTVFKSKVAEQMQGNFRQSDYLTSDKQITDFINKGQLAEIILPEVYSYPFWEAIKDGVLSPFRTIILDHPLNDKRRYVKTFKTQGWYNTESKAYDYLENSKKDSSKQQFFRKLCGRKQVDLLFNLESKAYVFNHLRKNIKGKMLIFGNRKDLLYKVTDNVVESKNAVETINKYRNDEIDIIGSSQLFAGA